MTITIDYQEGSGLERLVQHPLDPTRYVWSPF